MIFVKMQKNIWVRENKMPKKSKKSKKRTKPNVFVQSNTNDTTKEMPPAETPKVAVSETINKKITNDIKDVNYFPSELKKIGIIASAMVVVLGILTVILG